MEKIFEKNRSTLIAAILFFFSAFLIYTPSAQAVTMCTSDALCASGEWCGGGGFCLEDVAENDPCERAAQCQTPYCTDGKCSNAPAATPPTSPSSTPASGETKKPPSQQLINPLGGTNENPTGVTKVPVLIANIIKTILGVIGAVALFMFFWGGFGWLTSGGNPDKIKAGRDTLVWATIGLLVIFTSYTLVDVVFQALGAV